MKKPLLICILALLLALPGCGPASPEEDRFTVICTTYPIYLFASSITEGVEGVAVERLDTGSVSCLHDYTLSMADMKKIERADVIAVNGAGLEDFLEDALAASDAVVIDCSEGMELLPAMGHEGHGHETEYDPHFWLCRAGARTALENLSAGLSALDPDHAAVYEENLASALAAVDALELPPLPECPYLVTFHDGFQYFALESGLTLLKAIEEEEGAEASAAELKEVLALVREYSLPAIFTETNGSGSAARAIAWETGCEVISLDTIMSGGGTGLQPWLEAMEGNYEAVAAGLGVS